LSPEIIERYVKAGSAIRQIRNLVTNLVYEGKTFLEICESIEAAIRKKGCEPAFPCNIGVNEVTAHYTASADDRNVIPAGSVVKLDFGAHIEGNLVDAAATVILNPEYEPMLVAATEAVDKAVRIIAPGTKIKDVSRIIQRTIESYGYRPIVNLTGHRIMPYIVHTNPSIPNVASQFTLGKFDSDNVYAIEPFVTTKDAAGITVDGSGGNIYHLTRLKRPKDQMCRKLFDHIYETYKTLPFTLRWLLKETSLGEVRRKFEFLIREGCVKDYPVLYEQTGRPVVQMEHSILLTDKETITLT
jgi:methionyl aminopeptidase